MERRIAESDWKHFRALHPVALERFCERVLGEIEKISADGGKSFHQRYLDTFKLIERRDRQMAQSFDDPRRSNAFLQIASLRKQGLLTDKEFSGFGAETREVVQLLSGFHQA